MTLILPAELESIVATKVRTGRYASATEVIREALLLIEERDRGVEAHLAEVRSKIAEGQASLRAGKGTDGEAFMAGMDADLAALERHGP